MILVSRSTRLKPALLCLCSLGAIALAGSGPVHAQSAAPSQEASYDFDVPAQKLARSLSAIAERANMQVVYPDKEPLTIDAPAVHGRMTASQALATALAGSGYSYRYLRPGVITLLPSAEGNVDGERVTSAVNVQGTQGSPYFGGAGVAAGVNGTNGSRDITATEGTGSFTSGALTIGSKVPQALKDVPQSLSVLTSERMRQQNVTDFTTAMKQLPGVTLVQGSTNLEQSFFSRGFEITSIQIDGGPPLTTRYGFNDSGFFPQIDMSIYDHVELLRGAAGLFAGYGDPSGTVNLVRKKPLDHPQYTLEMQAGSWSNYRIVADATAPLAFDGRLRGRLVMTYQDNHFFYKTAKDNKQLIYGIAEFDLTPTTLLTAGINYSRQRSLPWEFGLPRYETGADLGLPRSTSVVFPWNRWNFDTTEIFGSVEQKLAENWNLKLNVTQERQDSTYKLGYGDGAVDPATNGGQLLRGRYANFGSKQIAAEATLSGAIDLFGQRQEFVLGANRSYLNDSGAVDYSFLVSGTAAVPYQPYPNGPKFYRGSPDGLRPPINIFAFNPNDPLYSEPPNSLAMTRHPEFGQIQSVIYLNMRLTAFDRLHLTTGLRWSKYESHDRREELCYFTFGQCAGKPPSYVYATSSFAYSGHDISWPPSATLSFDLTKQLDAYVGYTDIYQSQATALTSDLKPIDPITGSNWEAGLKWAPHDGRLNVSLALYQISKKGFAASDGSYDSATGDFVASNGKHFPNGGQIDPIHSCCYKSDPNRTQKSKGLDFEVSGEVLPGWQISASYTYNENKYEGTYYGANAGKPFVSIQPKNLYKLWMSYDFGVHRKNGLLSGLTISGGANGQSSGYYSGTGCKAAFVIIDSFSNTPACDVGGSFDYDYTVPGYVVFSGRIDYRLSDKWSVSANLENILDKTYYASVGIDPSSGNWYGTPRSVIATLRGKW